MDFWPNIIYKRKIKEFIKVIENYCNENSIDNNFKEFLFHKWNGIISNSFVYLIDAPKIYLANSKIFKNFYLMIDNDFKRDIMTEEEYKAIQSGLKRNKKIHNYLKKLMGPDSIV